MVLEVELSVGLFPGQGGYRSGVLDALSAYPAATAVVTVVDEVGTELLGRSLLATLKENSSLRDDELFAAEPEMVQLAVFATSVATFEVFRSRGARVSTLVGHSLGEIAALVCSGALSVADGTRILASRLLVLREHDASGGGMVALSCESARAEQILELLPTSGAVVAVDNSDRQVAVSGPADALRRVERIAEAIGLSATRLRAPHPFHNALLAPARQALAERIRGLRGRRFDVPVFSPILGRYYRPQDDLGELLASHLTTPVRFASAVTRAHAGGARIWVEFGAGRTLTNLVRASVSDVTVLTPLHGPQTALDDAVAFLGGDAATAPSSSYPVELLEPPASVSVSRTTPAAALVPNSQATHGIQGTQGSTQGTQAPVNVAELAAPAVPVVETTLIAQPAPVVAPSPVTPATAAPPAATPAPTAPEAARTPISREEIEARIRALYAAALEYPEEVFEAHAELEADLGVDSVKQTELMARLGDLFALGPRPEGMRMSDYRTFGKLVDFVSDSLPVANGAR